MDEILRALEDWGCDVSGSIERFMGDTELYMTCLKTVVDDQAYTKLGEALSEKKKKEAFEYAHTLKGVLANMGLTPIYAITAQIVEPLRNGSVENLEPVYKELITANEKLKEIIKG